MKEQPMILGSIVFPPQQSTPGAVLISEPDHRDAARYRAIRREVVAYNTRKANTKSDVGNLCDWADAKTEQQFDAEVDAAMLSHAALGGSESK